MNEHHQELSEQLDRTKHACNEFKTIIDEQKAEPEKHELMKQIDEWERQSIEKIQQVANEVRRELSPYIIKLVTDLEHKLQELTEKITQYRQEDDFADRDIEIFDGKLERLKDNRKNPKDFTLEYDSTSFIDKIRLTIKVPVIKTTNQNVNRKWIQNGITVAGGNDRGSGMNQLSNPFGICVDDNHTVYISDHSNHRIVEWKRDATTGLVVAGGNGLGNRTDQLNSPTHVLIDKERNSLIICDYYNKRVVRWPCQSATRGETIISNIGCCGLAVDDDGCLYISDYDKNEIRRYQIGENQGTVVAGGNKQGSRLDQLSHPTYIFVDKDHTVYISECSNHRVVKWMKGAKEGVIVAGGQGQGNNLAQLSTPREIFVDQSNNVYVADRGNHRIMRWSQAATQGSVVVGANGEGSESNQLSCPSGLSFDQEGNLYVSDSGNHRIQKFNIDPS